MGKFLNNHWGKIVIGIITMVIIIGGYILFSPIIESGKKVKEAHRNVEVAKKEEAKSKQELIEATINMIQTGLDLYYVDYGNYPHKISDIRDDMEKAVEGSFQKVDDSINNTNSNSYLKNFKYEVRGDLHVYKLTYTDWNGQTKSVEGNYQADFHKY